MRIVVAPRRDSESRDEAITDAYSDGWVMSSWHWLEQTRSAAIGSHVPASTMNHREPWRGQHPWSLYHISKLLGCGRVRVGE
jgi:hypothetical protein